jgi:hypothetical protein
MAAGRSIPNFLAKALITVGELILPSRLPMLLAASSALPAVFIAISSAAVRSATAGVPTSPSA